MHGQEVETCWSWTEVCAVCWCSAPFMDSGRDLAAGASLSATSRDYPDPSKPGKKKCSPRRIFLLIKILPKIQWQNARKTNSSLLLEYIHSSITIYVHSSIIHPVRTLVYQCRFECVRHCASCPFAVNFVSQGVSDQHFQIVQTIIYPAIHP